MMKICHSADRSAHIHTWYCFASTPKSSFGLGTQLALSQAAL